MRQKRHTLPKSIIAELREAKRPQFPEIAHLRPEQALDIMEKLEAKCPHYAEIYAQPAQGIYPPLSDVIIALDTRADGEILDNDDEFAKDLTALKEAHARITHYASYDGHNRTALLHKEVALALKSAVLETVRLPLNLERTGRSRSAQPPRIFAWTNPRIPRIPAGKRAWNSARPPPRSITHSYRI